MTVQESDIHQVRYAYKIFRKETTKKSQPEVQNHHQKVKALFITNFYFLEKKMILKCCPEHFMLHVNYAFSENTLVLHL